MSKFSLDLAEFTDPRRLSLKKDVDFSWDRPHREAYKNVKYALANSPVLAYFDPDKDVTLQVDASNLLMGNISYGSKARICLRLSTFTK